MVAGRSAAEIHAVRWRNDSFWYSGLLRCRDDCFWHSGSLRLAVIRVGVSRTTRWPPYSVELGLRGSMELGRRSFDDGLNERVVAVRQEMAALVAVE